MSLKVQVFYQFKTLKIEWQELSGHTKKQCTRKRFLVASAFSSTGIFLGMMMWPKRTLKTGLVASLKVSSISLARVNAEVFAQLGILWLRRWQDAPPGVGTVGNEHHSDSLCVVIMKLHDVLIDLSIYTMNNLISWFCCCNDHPFTLPTMAKIIKLDPDIITLRKSRFKDILSWIIFVMIYCLKGETKNIWCFKLHCRFLIVSSH